MEIIITFTDRWPSLNQWLAVWLSLGTLLIGTDTLFAQNNKPQSSGSFQQNTLDHRQAGFYVDPLLEFLKKDGPVPDDFLIRVPYQLRPGDVLSIQLKMPQKWMGRGLIVNSSGDIWIPNIGPVSVNGLTLNEALQKVEEQLSEQYQTPRVVISLDQIRPFDVHLSSKHLQSGRFTIPAGTRLSELLEASIRQKVAGKDQAISSLTMSQLNSLGINGRYILVHHKQNPTDTLDLAPYLTQQEQQADADPFLRDGDRIKISPLTKETPFIGISGAVNDPVELPYNTTDKLSDLLKYAGGLLDNANSDSIRVIRAHRRKVEFYTAEKASEVSLTANDRIVVPYQTTQRQLSSARIEVAGEIRFPGTYPIDEGETSVEEIISLAGGPTPDALERAAYIQRSQESMPDDQLTDGLNTVDPRTLKRASDQLRQGFEYLELEAALDKNRSYIDLSNAEDLRSTSLSNGDRVVIPRDYQAVLVLGQVNRPGYQSFETEKTIDDYIDKADGLTIAADQDRIFVIEAGTKAWIPYQEATLASGDMIFVDRVPLDELDAQRTYEVQLKNLRRSNLQLILTSISTITAVITTYVALFR
jgi:protein involved in polysaccharide export with SLBB domain